MADGLSGEAPVASNDGSDRPASQGLPQAQRRPVIRTPDQRVRVFISSTLRELAPERAAATEAISRLRLIPVLFELGARPHPPRDLYRAYLEQSHVFVGIYWQSYGWIAPDMDISGLEDEYNLSAEKPRLIYVKRPAPEREPKLQALLDRIRNDGVSYKPFFTPEELGLLIENDLALLLTESFEAARAPASGPAPETPERPPSNLPVQRGGLIGRERELAEVTELLMRDDTGLVTLTGPGGTGKTRLGLQVAAGLLERFADGAFLVSLAALEDPDLVAPTIAQALDVREAGGRPLREALKDFLRSKHVLLVLDNFEQVAEAAPLVSELLRSCPGLKVLATSRTPLHLREEKEYPVRPLGLPNQEELHDPRKLTQYPSVQLFIQRALEVKPDFQVTDENAPAVAEICMRLDGLPLAIELAAARIKMLSPQALLARLGTHLDLLTGGARDAPPRQQTLRDTIGWSYNLLNEAEKVIFRRVSVFVGGWTLDALTALYGGDETDAGRDADVLDDLVGLVDGSLVQQWDTRGEPRFGMLETIREYARERLAESGEEAEMPRRHAEYFAKLAQTVEYFARPAAEARSEAPPATGRGTWPILWNEEVGEVPHG